MEAIKVEWLSPQKTNNKPTDQMTCGEDPIVCPQTIHSPFAQHNSLPASPPPFLSPYACVHTCVRVCGGPTKAISVHESLTCWQCSRRLWLAKVLLTSLIYTPQMKSVQGRNLREKQVSPLELVIQARSLLPLQDSVSSHISYSRKSYPWQYLHPGLRKKETLLHLTSPHPTSALASHFMT